MSVENSLEIKLRIQKKSVYVMLLLAFVNWVSHYFYFRRFGLYEDDFPNIGFFLGKGFDYFLTRLSSYLTHWIQGHPLAFMPAMFTNIADFMGGFHALYLIAFVIVTVNSFLMYKILKILFPESELFAIVGALAFALFPPDTTKNMLLHVYVLQMSLMFLLIASLFYLKGWRRISYLIITLSILSYESPFMVFFGVPLLQGRFDKEFRKEYLKHIVVMLLITAAVLMIRKFTGESRVLSAAGDPFGVVYKIFIALLYGPIVNIYLFVRAPFAAIDEWIPFPYYEWYHFFLLYAAISLAVFYFIFSKLKNENSLFCIGGGRIHYNDDTYSYFKKIASISLPAAILISISYASSFTHFPPDAVAGRKTSVHLAATFGGSILFACITCSLIYVLGVFKLRKLGTFLLSLYLTLLVLYRSIIQVEFVRCQDYQDRFWTSIVDLCPDMSDGTIIIANLKTNASGTKYVWAHGWSDHQMLNHLFAFPAEWKRPPSVHVHFGDLSKAFILEKDKVNLKSAFGREAELKTEVPDSNLIIIKYDNATGFQRIDTSIAVGNRTISTKRKPDYVFDFKKQSLYHVLIE